MSFHRLISRDGYDECVSCGQPFDPNAPEAVGIAPCQTGTTDPHVWTAVPGGAECAYCLVPITSQTTGTAIPADCTPV